jgi:hypothetical protein
MFMPFRESKGSVPQVEGKILWRKHNMPKTKMKFVVILIGLVFAGSFSVGYFGSVVAESYMSYDSHTQTWTILPTGSDDTANIQDAFDNAIPGDTVYLSAGQFYVSHLEVADFHGTFRGAGKTSVIDVTPGGPVIFDYYPPWGLQWNYFFRFIDGDFSISHMQFDITPPDPADPWNWWDVETSIGDILFITGDNVNAHIERVTFRAHDGTMDGSNVADAIAFWSADVYPEIRYASGSLTVSHCDFVNVDVAILLERVLDSDISIRHNSITDGSMGVLVSDCPNSQILIQSNEFTDMANSALYHQYTDNTVFKNNYIKGSGQAGVKIGSSTGCLVLGNNFEHFDETFVDILLYYGTSQCTVVLGSADSIIDLGTDNIIYGGNP